MIAQGHMAALGGAPQTGASSEPGNEAGLSGTSDGQSSSSQQQHHLHSQSAAAAAAQKSTTSVQYCQMYMPGYVPLAAFAPQQQEAQDVQAQPPANADSERQTGPSTRDSSIPPNLLQIQLAQLEQYIEVYFFLHRIW